jgi:hypothetical protein
MAIAAQIMFQFISITLFRGFCSELHRVLGAKFPTVGVPLELALFAVHLGCCAARIVWEYACSLDPSFCCNDRLGGFGHLVSHLELVPTCLDLKSFFACSEHRVSYKFRIRVLVHHCLVIYFSPEFTPLALWWCRCGFFVCSRWGNVHTSATFFDRQGIGAELAVCRAKLGEIHLILSCEPSPPCRQDTKILAT